MRFALNDAVHQMRLVKDEHEIALLKRASRATVEALYLTLPLYQAGGNEGAIAESIRRHSSRLGCESQSFPPIIASGANALDVHYMKNDAPLVEGELVVTDIGCYADHYASDYTRTLPVGGRFSPRARELARAVYEAERAAAAACRAGVFMRGRPTPDGSKSLDTVARETLEAHGAPSDFGHGIGHPIGLFTHDVFQRGKALEAGMIIMIEPGVYIADEGIGLRLENAYVVRDDGCELITGGIPSDPDGIERVMAEAFAAPPAPIPLVLPSPEGADRAAEAPEGEAPRPAPEAGVDTGVTGAPE
jgi:Xaa-Pro aminopeptidase